MLGVAGGPHHVLLLLLVVPSLEPAPRTLPICHLANLPFVVCLAFNKYSRAAHSSDDPLILQTLHNRPGTWPHRPVPAYDSAHRQVSSSPELADDLQVFASLPAA